MKKNILFALDLEGVNNVAGEPYKGLYKGCEEWEIARRQAALEINAAADALFAAGVERVALWDNHAGGGNIDPADLDSRVELLTPDPTLPRMYFAPEFDCVCFFGYHAMEGTLGGVLAHTMNSAAVQYYKLNGKYIGEIDMDAYIAASHGLPSVLFVGGDVASAQASRAVSGIYTVTTKTELSRNKAIYRDNEELFLDIRDTVVKAVGSDLSYTVLTYPATLEKSFKRIEDAAIHIDRVLARGINAEYLSDPVLGKDAHTVVSTLYSVEDFVKSI